MTIFLRIRFVGFVLTALLLLSSCGQIDTFYGAVNAPQRNLSASTNSPVVAGPMVSAPLAADWTGNTPPPPPAPPDWTGNPPPAPAPAPTPAPDPVTPPPVVINPPPTPAPAPVPVTLPNPITVQIKVGPGTIAVDQANNPIGVSAPIDLAAIASQPITALRTIAIPSGIVCANTADVFHLICTVPAAGTFPITLQVSAGGQTQTVTANLVVTPISPSSGIVYRFFGQRPHDGTYGWYYSTTNTVPPFSEMNANVRLEGSFAVYTSPTPVCNLAVVQVHSVSQPSNDTADVLFNSIAGANNFIRAYVPNGWGPAWIEGGPLGYICAQPTNSAMSPLLAYYSRYTSGVRNFSVLVSHGDPRGSYAGLPTPRPGGTLIWDHVETFGYTP